MEDKDPFTTHAQYHGCWWPGKECTIVNNIMYLRRKVNIFMILSLATIIN